MEFKYSNPYFSSLPDIRFLQLKLLNLTGSISNYLFRLLIQQQPSADIMQLLNERSVRELREKLELEQKRQQAAENSKMTVNALFSLNSATAATSTVGGTFYKEFWKHLLLISLKIILFQPTSPPLPHNHPL